MREAAALTRVQPFRVNSTPLQERSYPRLGLGRGEDGKDLEIDEILPLIDPLVEKRTVGALHELEAPRKVVRDPTAEVVKALRSKATPIPESAIDGDGIGVSKLLDHEEEHEQTSNEMRRALR